MKNLFFKNVLCIFQRLMGPKIEGVMFLVVPSNHTFTQSFFKRAFPKRMTNFLGFSLFMECDKWGWSLSI